MYAVGASFMLMLALGLGAVALPIAGVLVLYKLFQGVITLVGGIFKGIGGGVLHLFRYVRGTLVDALRMVGGLLTAIFFVPMAGISLVLFRWRAARHYGGAVEDELVGSLLCLYRIGLGHPARLLGLTALTDGFERRIPDVIARAPQTQTGPSAVAKKTGAREFEGYKILRPMRAGGSGGRLFLAKPNRERLASIQKAGHRDPGLVVIKSFALLDGSTLPQIVRESRALESAKSLGLVLEHELTPVRFHYVMPFVDGEELTVIAKRLHEGNGPEGLTDRHVSLVMGYTADLLERLTDFHSAGLWHKDIKPSNILVAKGRVHLVDLGLVTPLQSAMTLTTHGTEYFRDPEMVRLAMNGVKVHEVDGVKFDIYSTGAVLFSLLENSFPAHGSLSRISQRCPEALRWIVRRAMAEMNQRYPSAQAMLDDLRVVFRAADPFAVRPAQLPSFGGGAVSAPAPPPVHGAPAFRPAAAAASVATDPTIQDSLERARKGREEGKKKHERVAAKVSKRAVAKAAARAKHAEDTRERRSRRRVFGGLALPFVLLGSMLGMGLALVSMTGSSHSVSVYPTLDGEVGGAIDSVPRTPQPTLVTPGPSALARTPLDRIIKDATQKPGYTMIGPGEDLPEDGLRGTVLIHDASQAALAGDWQSMSLHNGLRRAGFQVLGVLGEELELISRAQLELDPLNPGTPAGREAARTFLTREESVDHLLWFYRDGDDRLRHVRFSPAGRGPSARDF